MKLIYRGAEASLYQDKAGIIKIRLPKSYRAEAIDNKLRLHRTRQEARLVEKLHDAALPVPAVLKVDELRAVIEFQTISGRQLKEGLNAKNYFRYAKQIGSFVGRIHSMNIIHGDLTTSNMIVSNGKLYFVDFGLGFQSHRDEDKAVDLHVLKEALDSRHFRIAEKCFRMVLAKYREMNPDSGNVIERLRKVEQRGRYKEKY